MRHSKFRVVERFFETAKKYFWEHKTWGVPASSTKHDPKAIAKAVEDLKPKQKWNLSEVAKNLRLAVSSLHNVKKRAMEKEELKTLELVDTMTKIEHDLKEVFDFLQIKPGNMNKESYYV